MRSRALRWVLGFVGLLVWITAPAFAADQKTAVAGKPVSEIRDGAKLWSQATLESAKEGLVGIERAYQVSTVIRTVDTLKGEPLREAAVRLAKESGGDGIFILLAKRGSRTEVRLSREVRRRFSNLTASSIRDVIGS